MFCSVPVLIFNKSTGAKGCSMLRSNTPYFFSVFRVSFLTVAMEKFYSQAIRFHMVRPIPVYGRDFVASNLRPTWPIKSYFLTVSLVLYQRNSKEIAKIMQACSLGSPKKWPRNGKE